MRLDRRKGAGQLMCCWLSALLVSVCWGGCRAGGRIVSACTREERDNAPVSSLSPTASTSLRNVLFSHAHAFFAAATRSLLSRRHRRLIHIYKPHANTSQLNHHTHTQTQHTRCTIRKKQFCIVTSSASTSRDQLHSTDELGSGAFERRKGGLRGLSEQRSLRRGART